MSAFIREERLNQVGKIISTIAEDEVMSRFQALRPEDVHTKTSPHDWVTTADMAAESALAEHLKALFPEAVIIGEEGVYKTPDLLKSLYKEPFVFLLDPVDGTKNFARGSEDFAVMVALIWQGSLKASWIVHPPTGRLAEARLGEGAEIDGNSLHLPPPPSHFEDLKLSISTRHWPPHWQAVIRERTQRFKSNHSVYCAGLDYWRLATGDIDALGFWRLKPWDHAPGALLVQEAGGRVAYFDGLPYHKIYENKNGLLASSPLFWEDLHTALLPENSPDKAKKSL